MPSPRVQAPQQSEQVRQSNRKFIVEEWTKTGFTNRQATKKVKNAVINNQFLQSHDWETVSSRKSEWTLMFKTILQSTVDGNFVKDLQTYTLAAKENDENNFTWNMAINGPNSEGNWDAMIQELSMLEQNKQALEVVLREAWMNFLARKCYI
jgi:TPR repeat protein